MRSRFNRAGGWLRRRWLEVMLMVGFFALLGWYGALGWGFVPKPEPTPTAMPTPTLAPTQAPVASPTAAPTATPQFIRFDGAAAYRHVQAQTGLGPRPMGSEANRQTGDYIITELGAAGWEVEEQPFEHQGLQGRNIIARQGSGPVVILGAHYDTRPIADNDPDPARRSEPVLGGNDGASGVAVLLELARTLDVGATQRQVWLAFFDAEDRGRIDGWEFSVGAQYMADNLGQTVPEAVIVVDMIGDADQQIYKERNSHPELTDRLWALAAQLGYGQYFIPEYKHTITDDHIPFIRKGIAAVDLIDFDYPYWHTVQDTADKVSPASLERVGRLLQAFLEGS